MTRTCVLSGRRWLFVMAVSLMDVACALRSARRCLFYGPLREGPIQVDFLPGFLCLLWFVHIDLPRSRQRQTWAAGLEEGTRRSSRRRLLYVNAKGQTAYRTRLSPGQAQAVQFRQRFMILGGHALGPLPHAYLGCPSRSVPSRAVGFVTGY
ncbi:hypothetical protein VTI74DRAFT_694 [Chaetomium olivicolor]